MSSKYVLRDLFKGVVGDRKLITELIKQSIKDVSTLIRGSKYVISESRELGIRGLVTLDNNVIFVIRYSQATTEMYLKVINEDSLSILNTLGFNDLMNLVLSSKLRGLPKCVVVSKVIPSKGVYILLCGDEDSQTFPHIKVLVRNEIQDASASYCRISSYEDICSLLNNLIRYCIKLRSEFFNLQ